MKLVRARHVLTSGPQGEVRDGAVAVDSGRIVGVGSWRNLRDRFPDADVTGDGTGILTPGFVNSHGHFSEGLISGIGETATLWEWFVEVVEPIEAHLTREMAYVGTLLKGAEMALTGVTTVNDMFVHAPRPDEPVTPGVVDALEELGLRGEVSFGATDGANPRPVDAYLAEHQALADAAAPSRRCRFRMSASTVPSVSAPLWTETVRLAQEVGRLHIHFHEVREEVTAWRMAHRCSPIQYAAREGLLDAEVIAAHCVWVDDDDIATLVAHGVAVAHNPVANMILASGVCPVPRLRREGIVVALGTDGPASNDSQDMVEVLKTAALLQKVHHLQARALTAPQVVEMATIGGARALGLDAEIGSLELGKSADMVLFSERGGTLANIHDPYQKLVYCASGREVSDVWVGGEPVVSGGLLVTVDIEALLPRARQLATKLARDAGLASALAT
jgi:cytosine/adenosine deaminase-related metal-dependent hydrolase